MRDSNEAKSLLSHHVQRFFLCYLAAQMNCSPNTISSYRDTFRMLLVYLRGEGTDLSRVALTEVGRDSGSGFLQWLEDERKNSPATRNTRLAHLKSFFGFVGIEYPEHSGHCGDVARIPAARASKLPPSCPTEEEVSALLRSPDPSARNGLRHLAIMALLYDSGCRVQELIDLDGADVAIGRICKAALMGKGGKRREVPIFKETGAIIQRYINAFDISPSMPLFVGRKGGRLTRAGISWILNKHATAVRRIDPSLFASGIHPHSLRHGKASHLINSGVSIFNVRDFLEYSQPSGTAVY